MQPGVPFALLAATELLAVTALLGLGAVGFVRPLRGSGSAVALGGAVIVAVCEVITGASLTLTTSDQLVWGRTAGWLLLAAGFVLIQRRQVRAQPRMLSLAPLGAALPPVLAAAAAGLAAAGAAARLRIPGARLIAAGIAGMALAELLAPAARSSSPVAVVLLVVRVLGALGVLAGLSRLGSRSVLAKIVQAILAGVVATAVAVAGVVGTVVSTELGRSQGRQVGQAALGLAATLSAQATNSQQFASVLARCPDPQACSQGETFFSTGTVFAALVRPGNVVHQIGGPALDEASQLALGASGPVEEALATPGFTFSGFVLLRGAPARMVALGLASHRNPADPTGRPSFVAVFGQVVDAARLLAAQRTSTFAATVLTSPDLSVVASTLPADAAGGVAARGRRHRVALTLSAPVSGTPPGVVTLLGHDGSPTTSFAPLSAGPDVTGLLAVSAPASAVLGTQRAVLELLFLALVLIGLLVAGVAVAVGRRVAEPVRRLTAAAAAVSAGDLTARAEVVGEDEVAELSRAFDAMTTSLTRSNDVLRGLAATEAATRGRLETVLDAMVEGLVVLEPDGVVRAVNPAATKLLGPVLGRRLEDVLTDPGGNRFVLPGEGLLAAVGGAVWVRGDTAPLPEGRGAVVTLRDITEERRVERMKTEFLANVSHELRTPLTPVLAYADMLRRRPDLPEPLASYAAQIAGSGRRLSRVVDLLVDVAALDAGRVSVTPSRVPVGQLVDEVLGAWRARAAERAQDLRRRVSASLPPLFVDPHWLRKALDEVMDNAVKFSEPGSPIVLTATANSGGGVRLTVRDSGPGLDDADRIALFADFVQADGSATRSREGMGLGLAFVRRAVGVAGIGLEVQSDPGGGVAITFLIPVVPPEPRPAAGPQGARNTPSRG